MVEEIKDPILRSFLSELVSIVDKAKERGLSIRLVGPAAIYLHILNCRECIEIYERLLARGAALPRAPAFAPAPAAAAPARPEVKEVAAEAKPKVRAPPPPKILEVEVLEDPRALEDEVLLSMLMLKSELVTTARVEVPSRDLIKYVSSILAKQVRDLRESYIYVSIRMPEKHIRLLYSRGKLTGARVDLSDGTVLNGKEALSKIATSDEVIKARAYVFKVPIEVAKQFNI